MPFKCYYCLVKFPDGTSCARHCLENHQHRELCIYRPHASGYIAKHYGFVPSNLAVSDVHFNEDNEKVTYSTRDGQQTPIAKAKKLSATPERTLDETLPYDTEDAEVCIYMLVSRILYIYTHTHLLCRCTRLRCPRLDCPPAC